MIDVFAGLISRPNGSNRHITYNFFKIVGLVITFLNL